MPKKRPFSRKTRRPAASPRAVNNTPQPPNTHKGAAILVKNAVIRSANKRMLEMFGYELSDLRGMPFEEFIAPEFRGAVLNNYARMVAGQITKIHFKLEVLSKNGAQVPAQIFASVIETRKGPYVMAQVRGFNSKKKHSRSIRQLFTSARCLIWNASVVKKEGRFVWTLTIANEDACRQFLPMKTGAGQSYKDAWRMSINPNDRELMDLNSSSALLEGKSGYSQEFRCTNVRGEIRWLSEDVHIKKTGRGRWRLIGVCMDVTGRKNTEEALKASEERYKKLVDLSPDAIAVHSQGRVVFVNKAAVKLFGARDYHELIGRPVLSFVHDDSKEEVTSRMKIMYDQGKVMPLILEKFVRLNGEEIYVEVAAMPLIFRGVPAIMVVIRDVSERVTAENELKTAHRKMADIIEFLPDPVFVVDRNRRVIAWNRAVEGMTGVPKAEILGKSDLECSAAFYGQQKHILLDLLFPESGRTLPEMQRNYDYIEKKGDTLFAEVFSPYLNAGKGMYIWVKASALYDSEGRIAGAIESVRDITERKQFEEKIRYLSFNDKLTGLYNRAFCEEEMARLDTRRELPLSIIVGDVNNLKVTNDVFGHHEGDRLLAEVSKVLKDSCRKGDIVSRWGGDEFLMLLPRTEAKVAEMIVERISEKCTQISGLSLKPSVALGTATKEAEQDELETVLKEAEGRMYCNKLFFGDSLHGDFISTVEKAILDKGKESRRHIEHLRKYVLEFGQELELPPEQVEALSTLAVLHDIGKVSIPEEVLLKPGPLTRDETNIMKKHSELGYRIAQTYHLAKDISDSILHHHERWDGTGYPRGLKGSQIPLSARLLSIVEAYDVMTNRQPYRGAMDSDKALEEIIRNSGTQFDPELVKVFLKVVSRSR